MALTENMDNLAANGLIDLGNIFLRTGDLRAAEPYFRRALDTAQRGKVRRIEARARIPWALCASRMADLGKPGRSSRPGSRSTEVPGTGVNQSRRLRCPGRCSATARATRRRHSGSCARRTPIAIALQDKRVEAQLRERLADNLRDSGEWPAAVENPSGRLHHAPPRGPIM